MVLASTTNQHAQCALERACSKQGLQLNLIVVLLCTHAKSTCQVHSRQSALPGRNVACTGFLSPTQACTHAVQCHAAVSLAMPGGRCRNPHQTIDLPWSVYFSNATNKLHVQAPFVCTWCIFAQHSSGGRWAGSAAFLGPWVVCGTFGGRREPPGLRAGPAAPLLRSLSRARRAPLHAALNQY